MKTAGISGFAIGLVVVGVLLMYSALKNYTILDTARWAASGGQEKFRPTPRVN